MGLTGVLYIFCGPVAEWADATDLKSVGVIRVGSSPTRPRIPQVTPFPQRSRSSRAERAAHNRQVAGSNPAGTTILFYMHPFVFIPF